MTGQDQATSYFQSAPIVLVIGCGDLGMACARVLGERSPLVVVDVDQRKLDESIATLRHEGYSAAGHVCDITDAGQVDRLAAFLAEGKGVKVLAHVAAIGRSALGWRKILDVSLRGAHLVANAVGPHIVTGGVAVFMSSIGSRLTPTTTETDDVLDEPMHAEFYERLAGAFGREPGEDEAYQLSKRGMNLLVTRLAVEWGRRQVRALTVSPGIVDTSMARAGGTDIVVKDEDGSERMMTWPEMAQQVVPLGRVGIIPEVSAVVAFMASDAASFITGIDVPVDGGTLAFRQPRGTIATG